MLFNPNSVDAHEGPPIIIALKAQNTTLVKVMIYYADRIHFDFKQIYGQFEQENLFHKVINLIDIEDAAIELLRIPHAKWNGFVNSTSNKSNRCSH